MRRLLWILGMILCFTVRAQNKQRHSVLIHEILPDPTPSRGLPNTEFIELKNVSANEVQLRNWRISNGSSSGKVTGNFVLKPDSLVILVAAGSISFYTPFGTCISLTPFPSLSNDGDTLLLFNEQDSLIHAVAYNSSWYQNPVKKEGGWSLEMIDASQPCLQSLNWTASLSPSGGTPGKPNHASGKTRDTIPPWITNAYLADSLNLIVAMNKPMTDHPVSISPLLEMASEKWLPPLFQVLQVRLRQPFPKDSLLTLWLKDMADCSGNSSPPLSTTVGRFASRLHSECVINEILFDPPVGGSDYIEIFNRSSEPIDISQLRMANRNSNGRISTPQVIVSAPYPLLPNQYLVLTEDSSWIHHYYAPGMVKMIETALPGFPDDEGTIVILNVQGDVVDELHYSSGWHYPLMSSTQGVSLERINPMGISQQQQNWHSAATTTRFGTPGYRNAQSAPFTITDEKILTASSLTISPDQDGFQDILRLKYTLDQPGYLANIDVYTSWGAPVHTIANNELCGIQGEFIWNGLSFQQQRLKRGAYIVQASFHLPDGKVKHQHLAIGIW